VTEGSYNQHPWLGAAGTDMTYAIAQVMNTNVTYGWLITQITAGGPAENASLQSGTQQALVAGEYVTIGGDIITAIDQTRITNFDNLSTYLEEHTTPQQTINITIIRNSQTMTIAIELAARPTTTT
jgi:S1-C subfamily serine protease